MYTRSLSFLKQVTMLWSRSAGHMLWNMVVPLLEVIHGVGPKWCDVLQQSTCWQRLIILDWGLLQFPNISSGLFGVSRDRCDLEYFRGIVLYGCTRSETKPYTIPWHRRGRLKSRTYISLRKARQKPRFNLTRYWPITNIFQISQIWNQLKLNRGYPAKKANIFAGLAKFPAICHLIWRNDELFNHTACSQRY